MSEQGARQVRLLKQLNAKQRQSNEASDLLLQQILQEQRQTNQLLLMLIEAMGEDSEGMDAEPQTYMDGSPI